MINPESGNTACVFCGSSDSIVAYQTFDIFQNNFDIRRCRNCDAWFLSPFPSKELLEKAYDVTYYGDQETKFKDGPIEKALDSFRTVRAKRLAKLLPQNARILDIGCGNGNFLEFISRYGNFELHGIERDPKAAARALAKPGMQIKTTPLVEHDFAENFFHAITLFHVFEHLSNPSETLSIIDKILEPGGYLYISFPNIDSCQAKIFKGKWLHLDPPRHLLFFAPKTFIKLIGARGYDCVHVKYLSLEQNPYGMVQSVLNTFFSKREILFERLKGNKDYAPECGKFCTMMQKLFFVASFPFFTVTDVFASMFHKGATVSFIFRKK